jgi:hypothetical protein
MLTPQSSIIAAISPPRKAASSGSGEEAQRREPIHCYNNNAGYSNTSTDYFRSSSPLRGEEHLVGPSTGTTSTSATESAFPLGSCPQEHAGGIRVHCVATTTARTADIGGSRQHAQQGPQQRSNISSSDTKRMPSSAVSNGMASNPTDTADVSSVGSSNLCPNSPISIHQTNNNSNASSGGDLNISVRSISHHQVRVLPIWKHSGCPAISIHFKCRIVAPFYRYRIIFAQQRRLFVIMQILPWILILSSHLARHWLFLATF